MHLLDSDKYFLCARRMKKLLVAKNNWEIVSRVEVMKAGITEDVKFAFLQRSQSAILTISTAVSDHCLVSTTDAEDLAALWRELKARYQVSAISTIDSLFTDYHLVSMQEEESVTQ